MQPKNMLCVSHVSGATMRHTEPSSYSAARCTLGFGFQVSNEKKKHYFFVCIGDYTIQFMMGL